MSSRSLCSGLVVALIGTAHADGTSIELSPRLSATVSNESKQLETGLEWSFAEKPPSSVEQPGTGTAPTRWIARLYATIGIPFDDGKVVRVDEDSSNWNVSIGGDVGRKAARVEGGGDASRDRIGLEISSGRSKFAFYPAGGTEELTQTHWSWTAKLSAIRVHEVKSDKYAPQIAITYDRSYAASPAVGIVTPADGGVPALVQRTVSITEPTVAPALDVRVSCPIALFPDSQFLIGPSVDHVMFGAQRAYSPFGESGRLAGELWIYYVPKQSSVTGARIGLAPYATVRTFGDKGERFDYGALAELRITTEIYDY